MLENKPLSLNISAEELQIIEIPKAETEVVEGTAAALRCMALSSPPMESPHMMWIRSDTGEVLAVGDAIANFCYNSNIKPFPNFLYPLKLNEKSV